jgi:spermidine/putrescine transport system permease protein
MLSKMSGHNKLFRGFTILPAVIWLSVLFVIPVAIVLMLSFFQIGDYGIILFKPTFANMLALADGIYMKVIIRTLIMASSNALLCLIIGYPMAYYISMRKNKRYKNALLFFTLLPFWTNFLIRTYAWVFLLGNNGLINSTLIGLHVIKTPMTMLFTPFAVQLGLLYNYLPFMILPLYASIEKIEEQYYFAAADLGASHFDTFLNVTIPLSVTGIVIGVFLVFIPSLGEYIIPDILGGGKTAFLGNIITEQYLGARNWPVGSSMVFLMTTIVLLGVSIRRLFSKNDTRNEKSA